MKKILSVLFVLFILIAAYIVWLFLGSNTSFEENKKSVYIKTGSKFDEVLQNLTNEGIVKNKGAFKWLAQKLDYNENILPGKYSFDKGSSIYSIVKTLKSGKQTPVNFLINKLRTKEDLIQKIAANFECDSAEVAAFLYNKDSLSKYKLDTNTVMTMIIPNTYSIFWNTSPSKIFKKLFNEQDKFWNNTRKEKAKGIGLTTAQVYTLASIVEEETNAEADKGKIASVYLNRIEIGMKLGADPTVKYAMRDFGLKRIFNKHLSYPSPYNTYQHAGLPPGPICTPSIKTIDAVLSAPSTTYLYFVAQPNLTGLSNFATNYQEHMKYAKEYQVWIEEYLKSKK